MIDHDTVPRRPRLESPDGTHHVVVHGTAGTRIVADDADRLAYVHRLGATVVAQGWRCLAWCLLDTHVHLVVETPHPNLGSGMRHLTGGYARSFNVRHGRRGHLWASRYHATPIETDAYLLTACVYVALNPVRAGLVDHPDNWRWGGHRATAGLEPQPAWLDPTTLLTSLSSTPQDGRITYRKVIADALDRAREGKRKRVPD